MDLGPVAGDALDVATLRAGLERSHGKTNVVLAAVAGGTVLDVLCGQWLRERASADRFRLYRDRSGFPRGFDNAQARRATSSRRMIFAPRSSCARSNRRMG
jgi:hypothetical protein